MKEKNELIQKLEAIFALHNKALTIKRKMDDFIPEDHYERKVVVPKFPGEYENSEEREDWEAFIDHSDEDAVEQMAEAYDNVFAPKKPAEPKIKEFQYSEDSASKSKRDKLGCFSYIAAGFSGFCLLSIIVGTAEGAVGTIVIMTIVAALVFAFLRFKLNLEKRVAEKRQEKALAEYTNYKNGLLAEHEKAMRNYEDQCASYKLRRGDFLDEYSRWREVYLESKKEEAEIAEKLEEDRLAAVKKIEKEEFTPVLEEMVKVNGDLIATDYLPALGVLIDLLKSGRADDLKEAINLYEDMLYRERQLQLQREQEENRHREEEQRRQDEERRYREDMQFRKDQERQRRREEERRQQDAERRHQEDMKQRERMERDRQYQEQRRADEERRRADREERDRKMEEDRATRHQCNTCALCGKCSMSFRRPNCASYRPR